jgi:hypothetical protein
MIGTRLRTRGVLAFTVSHAMLTSKLPWGNDSLTYLALVNDQQIAW